MPNSNLGRTLVIANPTAHSGKGAKAATYAKHFLDSYSSATTSYSLKLTNAMGDAIRMARGAAGRYDTVLALGGDGIIHEVVNGLMQLPESARPQMGIIPVGSGNDYARTLGMKANDASAALGQLVRAKAVPVEVGRVNGVHFMETLSFGLDAAIALDTTTKREVGSKQHGERLYVSSGIKLFSHNVEGYECTLSIDGGEPEHLRTLIFAIQVGPTYGGGFRVCPNATPTDGLLDICHNVKMPSVPRTLALFGLARTGHHVGSSAIRMRTATTVAVDFDCEPPCQTDGEKLTGSHFDVEVVPNALKVLAPIGSPLL